MMGGSDALCSLICLRHEEGILAAGYLGFQLHGVRPELCFSLRDVALDNLDAMLRSFGLQRSEMRIPAIEDDGLPLVTGKVDLPRLVPHLHLLQSRRSVRLDVLQIRNAVVVQDHSGTTACRGFGGFHALACEALESLAAAAHGVERGQFAASLFKCLHLLDGAIDVARVFDCSKDAGQEVRRFVVLHNGSS